MSITFKRFIEHFKGKTENVYLDRNNEDIKFDDAKLITQNQIDYCENFIYICKTSMLQEKIRNKENISLILINDNKTCIENFFRKSANIIEIKENEDIFQIYNEIREIFYEDIQIANDSAILLKASILENGIDNIVTLASNILKNPIIVIDSSFKILTYSNKEDILDPYWRKNITKRYCSYEFIVGFKNMKRKNKNIKDDEPYEFTCTESSILKLISGVKVNNKHIASVIVLECKKKFSPRDKEILALTSRIIAQEMKKNSFYRNANDVGYEGLICDILDGILVNKEDIKERIKSANIKFSKNLSVFAFNISNYNYKNKYLGYLTDNFNYTFPIKDPIYYNDKVIIIEETGAFTNSTKVDKKIKDFLISNNIYVGISKEFSDISEAKKYYIQAVKALDIGKILNSKNNSTFYSLIQLYDLLGSYNTLDYKDFYSPHLIKLKQYDNKKHTDLYKTLFIYLKNNQSMEKTSEELFIHRNTTRYRIKRIVELVNIDFSNIEEVLNIYMSYKITDYLKKTSSMF
ncbi:PucR family transcriptional regulator [Clostridium uliginosum]|uniref:PucR C-terminal helix-turn-helix domain-containing protein n=1 Tax=Clostridium uliginosum TaxID=119641 RepID=A0A1I1HHJ7_9CLOT|nr:helix-turn-helix domain-containing protein [Clostridium uliginosum]SFC20953.1 PucR C-terminal helix-turn-helix domain-containing protein [Clostridium uliginosum]